MIAEGNNQQDFKSLSKEALLNIQSVLKIVLDSWEINGLTNQLRIPFKKFEDVKIYLDDVRAVLNKVDGVNELYDEMRIFQKRRQKIGYDNIIPNEFSGLPSEEELNQYLFLTITSPSNVLKVKNLVDERLDELKVHESIKTTSKTKTKIIRHIECIKHLPNTNKLMMVINENYNDPFEVKFGKYWSKFYELAEK